MKRCDTCGTEKPQEEFSIGQYKLNRGVCKLCTSTDKVFTDYSKGYLYIIINDAWPDWCKIGLAEDVEKRLAGYQTASPFRDYRVGYSVYTQQMNSLETLLHTMLEAIGYERKNEWIKIPINEAIALMTQVININHTVRGRTCLPTHQE